MATWDDVDSGAILNDAALIATVVLNHVCDCLEATPLGKPERCQLSHGSPAEIPGCPSQLSVWWEAPSPILSNLQDIDPDGDCRDDINWKGVLVARLVRPCWPMIGIVAGQAAQPPVETYNTAATNLLIDMRVLLCCFPDAVAAATQIDGILAFAGIAAMQRVDPQGTLAGWECRATVTLGGWTATGS